MKQLPSQDYLKEIMSYCPIAGVLTWRRRPASMFKDGVKTAVHAAAVWNTRFAGKPAFANRSSNGYLTGRLQGDGHRAHRIIWKLVNGTDPIEIDHINGDRTDNRIANLREVTRSENNRNQSRSCCNTSGQTGVGWDKQHGKWRAYIKTDRVNKFIGLYSEFDDAVAARKLAESNLGFHENHGRLT